MKKFTVITPTWNQAEYIEDTIQSVIGQTYKNLEYIIVDNCSDDGTREIVEKYAKEDGRIMYIREPDKGQAEAINKGLERATGDIVCWLNSDDYYYDDKVLEKVADAFASPEVPDIVVGDAWYCDKEKNLTEYNKSNRGVPNWVISRWYYIVQPSVFWKRSKLRLDESYTYAFDWKFFILMFEQARVKYTEEAYSVYRMYEDNKTGQDNAKRKYEIYRLQEEIGVSKWNTAWCKHVYKVYEAAEKKNRPQDKKRVDFWSRLLFHLTGKRICSF